MFEYIMTWEIAVKKEILTLKDSSSWSIVRSEKFKEWINNYNIDYKIKLSTRNAFPHSIILIFNNNEDLSHFILRWC